MSRTDIGTNQVLKVSIRSSFICTPCGSPCSLGIEELNLILSNGVDVASTRILGLNQDIKVYHDRDIELSKVAQKGDRALEKSKGMMTWYSGGPYQSRPPRVDIYRASFENHPSRAIHQESSSETHHLSCVVLRIIH